MPFADGIQRLRPQERRFESQRPFVVSIADTDGAGAVGGRMRGRLRRSCPCPAGDQRRGSGCAGHRPDGVVDVVPAQRLVYGELPRHRRLAQPGRVPRGDPLCARQHQSHLPHHAAVRHVVAVGCDGLRGHHDLRPRGVQPAVGPLGRRHLGHAADRAGRTDHRQVDGGAGAGLRQLVLEAIQLGPVRADVLLVRGERQRARMSASSTCSRSSATSSARAARCRSATARSSTTPRSRAGHRSPLA